MPSQRLRPFDFVLAALAVLVATLAVWPMGWLRDDWLLLWRALEPVTAPARSGGVFPRPTADLAWSLATRVSGDQPWALHSLALIGWWVYVLGLLRWHRGWGGGSRSAVWIVAFFGVGHGALVEPRLWAAASNGVLAAAFGVWGAWLLACARTDAPKGARIRALATFLAGTVLLVVGVLARADAVLWLALALAERRGITRTWTRALGWAAVAAVGLGVLAWMASAGGGWSWSPADAGRLLRRLLVPWGPPMTQVGALSLGAGGLLLALGLVLGGRIRGPRRVSLLATAVAVMAAAAVVGWSPAGRYLIVPAGAFALALGGAWETARTSPRGWLRITGLTLLLVLHLTGALTGRTTRDLIERSRRETTLYETARAMGDALPTPLVVLDPPHIGWRSSAADLENVVSCAARRPVPVRILTTAEAGEELRPALAWRDGEWTWVR